MIEIAKAMMTKAQIIIMDEPTATLTDKEIRRLFDMIHNLKAKDVSFVYISHRMAEIFEISDEITVMRDGVSVMYDETTNLTYNQIVKAMVGRELDEQFPDRTYEPQDIVLNVKRLNNPLHHIENQSFYLKKVKYWA